MAYYKRLSLIHGPAGTGKTQIFGTIASHWLIQEGQPRILFCAPSNAAADRIAEALLEYPTLEGKFVRILSEQKEDIFNVDFKTLRTYDLLHRVLTLDMEKKRMFQAPT